MRTKLSLVGIVFSSLLLGSCTVDDVFTTTGVGLSGMTVQDKVVLGLKTALQVGIDTSASLASRANGYLANKAIKILLPQEAQEALAATKTLAGYIKPFTSQMKFIQSKVELSSVLPQNSFTSNLNSSVAMVNQIADLETLSDSVVKYMNRAAEKAAPRSVPIFKNAITSMSITDGLSLLNSSDSTAATKFLNGKTFTPLVEAYSPLVDSTLSLVPLTQYWSQFRLAYNTVLENYNTLVGFQNSWNGNTAVSLFSLKITALKPVSYKTIETESLGAWTTTNALGGLFYLVGDEEKNIRRNPLQYVQNLVKNIGDILTEVFGNIMQMDAPASSSK